MNTMNQLNNGNVKKAKEIDLKELFKVIQRRIWLIIAVIIFAGAAGAFLNIHSSPLIYQASSRIIISADADTRLTMQVIVKDSTILDRVVKELNLNRSTDKLANQITVSSLENSQVVSISVADQSPILAAKIADTTAQIFKEEVPNIMGQNNVRILSNAKISKVPVNPKSNRMLIYSIVGGMIIGVGLAFLLESLNNKIRSESEIETLLGLPVIGEISKVNKRNIKRKSIARQHDLELRGENIGYK